MKSLSRVLLFAIPWTVAYQAPLSMGFSRQEYKSGLPFPSPGDLPDPGIEPRSPALQADALPLSHQGIVSVTFKFSRFWLSEVAQSCLTLCNPWTVAHQAPPSMGFSRQEYKSGLPFPSPGDIPDPGIEPRSPALQADALTSEPPGKYFLSLAGALIIWS